jgi:hypothetical protein
MRSTVWTAIALLAFAYTLLPAIPASAGYGAIAWDQETARGGWSWNERTQDRADELAVEKCKSSGCKVFYRVGPALCGAVATTRDGKHAGAASRPNRDAARSAALKDCEKDNAGECVVRVAGCNK